MSGKITPTERYVFELSGGSLCLDFANTVDSRLSAEPQERLGDYGDLVRWAVQSELLTAQQARRLLAAAEREVGRAAAVLRRGRELREAIFEVFSARAREMPAPPAAIDTLNKELPKALTRLRLVEDGADYRTEWENEDSLDRMLWPVVRSAAELLTSDELVRVRECAADTCAWLFLDRSRNRSRRWCDMAVCGNRDKVRRFRQRSRS
ncbi:MAG: ABATE domain-containing protein [Gemmatimonadales bacterium]|jgi:predicted RNA-binding Zn ribbon-like protein